MTTLRLILSVIVGTLGVLFVGFSGLNAYDSYRQYEAQSSFAASDRISTALLKFAVDLAIERGLTNAPLHAADALPGDRRPAIDVVRSSADKALPGILTQLRQMPELAASRRALEEAENAYRDYASFRSKVDENLLRKRPERSSEVVDKFASTITGVIDRVSDIRRTFEALVPSHIAAIVQLVQTRSLVADMAEEAGRERAVFGGNIAQRTPFTQNDIRDLSEHRGQIELVWNHLKASRQRTDLPMPMLEAVSRVDVAYIRDLSATRQAVLAAAATGQYPLTGREWVDQSGAAIGTIVKLADAVGDATRDTTDKLSAAAFRDAAIYGALLVFGVIISILSLGILSRRVIRPLKALTAAMQRLAGGDKAFDIPGVGRTDELGEMAATVEVFKTKMIEMERLQAEQSEVERRQALQRKAEMIKLADQFEGAVGEIVETVSLASTELETSAGTLTKTAERAQELTTMVAVASEGASANVQSVASATEEMASSVTEIGRQVQESARIAGEAVDQARKTNTRVNELSQSANRIGDVVELINTIAGQTNLLALNATIEAARAGDAGRGFAVVASEVKALAEQTARATGEISQQINDIQAATQESVVAIKEIGDTIGRLSEISSTVASAVEAQGAATQDISRNVQQAAQGSQQVSSNISDVQRGASETGSASSQVLSAAQSLTSESNRLKLEVERFLNSVRAA